MSEEDIHLTWLSINYTDLEDWLGTTDALMSELIPDDGSINTSSLYPDSDAAVVKLEEVDISFNHRVSYMADIRTYACIKRHAYIDMAFNSAMHIDQIQYAFADPIRNFITLSVGKTVWPKEIEFLAQNDRRGKLFYTTGIPEDYRNNDGFDELMPLRYRDIAENLSEVITSWYRLSAEAEIPLRLFFAVHHSQFEFLHLEFLTLVQALEVYLRLQNRGKLHLDDRIGAVLSSLAITYNAELVRRIAPDPKQFTDVVSDTRHYFTHYMPHPRQAPELTHDGQYRLVQKLRLLIRVCFCKDVGVTAETCAEGIYRNPYLKRWLD
jgi:hypothetical protein